MYITKSGRLTAPYLTTTNKEDIQGLIVEDLKKLIQIRCQNDFDSSVFSFRLWCSSWVNRHVLTPTSGSKRAGVNLGILHHDFHNSCCTNHAQIPVVFQLSTSAKLIGVGVTFNQDG